jgi:hypothetical protein
MQIFPADLVVSADNAALQDRPKTFDCVRMNCANDMLANGVIDNAEIPTAPPAASRIDRIF